MLKQCAKSLFTGRDGNYNSTCFINLFFEHRCSGGGGRKI